MAYHAFTWYGLCMAYYNPSLLASHAQRAELRALQEAGNELNVDPNAVSRVMAAAEIVRLRPQLEKAEAPWKPPPPLREQTAPLPVKQPTDEPSPAQWDLLRRLHKAGKLPGVRREDVNHGVATALIREHRNWLAPHDAKRRKRRAKRARRKARGGG